MDEDHTIDVTSLMAQGVINVLGEVLKKEIEGTAIQGQVYDSGMPGYALDTVHRKQTYKGEVVITASVDGPTGTRCWRK